MEKKYIAALDAGTTSSRCIIFDKDQNIMSVAQKEFPQIYPKAGWVEHNPTDLYVTQYSVLIEAIAQMNIDPEEIAGIGITNQRETTIVWDRETGLPVYNAIVWQCRRTADICEALMKDQELCDYIKENTGLVVDAYFSGTKIKWILDNVPGAREKAEAGRLLFGTVDTWLIWKLTNGKTYVTDYTNASRTMLFNIRTLGWDKRILDALGIPESMLPEVCDSSEVYGYTNLSGVDVPICGIAGDQQAALFGQTCFEKGNIKNTYGTGNFILMNTGDEFVTSKNGLVTTIAYGLDGKVTYALEGSVFVGGAVIQWLRDEMRFFTSAPDADYFGGKVPDTQGVYFVPAFTGLGAPHWDMYARGSIFGLTRGTTRNHIIRAALESIAYQSKDVIDAMMADTGLEINEIKVDGGASVSDIIMQFQADITGKTLRRPIVRETTALGAAYLAGLAVGFWESMEDVKNHWSLDKIYEPKMDEETREKLLHGWEKAVECAKLFHS
ncbi:MAG TPA: glycerol kinase GlpK [Candidatus Gallacutalibacter pullicola]|uniref:Glycerol kinase n=1 Tax=Candidatus Gallacutalibacter pullicola TaxID=2840830 RepID=A0A9D1DS84_9FIRM|nr:glycerol kinase GlpK [Candidatus Gallacutalibacter pullicola]